MATGQGVGTKATTAQWIYASVFGAPQPPETSSVASSVPVIDVETSKRQFVERNKIGVDVKGSPGGTAWTLTSKDLMKEAPGGVAWQANPEEVVDTSVNTKRAAPKSAAQTVQEFVNGTASHALSTFAVLKEKILNCLPRMGGGHNG